MGRSSPTATPALRAGPSCGHNSLTQLRPGEGRTRAKARGVKMGRPPKLTPHQVKEALRCRDAGESMRDIARSYNVSHSAISRLGT